MNNHDINYIDSHFHLLIMKQKEIEISESENLMGMDIGTTCDDFPLRLPLIKEHKNIKYSLGCGPWCADEEREIDEQLQILTDYVRNSNPVAIGEIGIDYYRNYDRKKQKQLFISQIEIANNFGLPIIIHSRDSEDDIIEILKNNPANKGGIFHCFSMTEKALGFGLDNDFFISFSGNITYKGNKNLKEMVRKIPLGNLLIETDSPYLAPIPLRGKSNSPLYINHTYSFIAEQLGLELDVLKVAMYNNLNRFYMRAVN